MRSCVNLVFAAESISNTPQLPRNVRGLDQVVVAEGWLKARNVYREGREYQILIVGQLDRNSLVSAVVGGMMGVFLFGFREMLREPESSEEAPVSSS